MRLLEIGSKELIRDINNRLVLETIIEKTPLSRADLSKELGLTKATISSIVQEQIDKKLVLEIGCGDTSIGRKPTLLMLNAAAAYSICIDLAVHQIDFMVTDLIGKIVCFQSQPYCNTSHFDAMEAIICFIDNFLSSAPKTEYGMIGITIAIHGVVDHNQIVFTPYYNLSSYPFAQTLFQRYHVPIHLYNEANLAVIGENTFVTNVENIAAIVVHAGIGLGMILNGQLYEGFHGYAGEFGHTIIELDGRKCPCGNCGCLEQYGSQRALLHDLAIRKKEDFLTFEQFESLYRLGDPDAIDIANQFVKIMAAGMNNLLNLCNPEIIVLNSRFTQVFPDLLEDIKALLHAKTYYSKTICLSQLNDKAILYGGACINIKDFLGIIHFNPLQIGIE